MSFDATLLAALAAASKSSDAGARAGAASALAGLGSESGAGALLLKMVNDPSDLVRAEAVDGLGTIRCIEALEAVRERLRDDESALVRAAAAESLGDLNDTAATTDLVSALRDDDSAVRAYAANSLGLLAGDEVLPELEQRLRDEPVAAVRAELEAARARLGAPDALVRLVAMFDQTDEELGTNMLNVWSDLLSRRQPPQLGSIVAEATRQLILLSKRFPLLTYDAEVLAAQVSRSSHLDGRGDSSSALMAGAASVGRDSESGEADGSERRR